MKSSLANCRCGTDIIEEYWTSVMIERKIRCSYIKNIVGRVFFMKSNSITLSDFWFINIGKA